MANMPTEPANLIVNKNNGQVILNTLLPQGEPFYQVESIIKHQYVVINDKKKIIKYYIKWKNYSQQESTWQPQENLVLVQHMLDEYKIKHKLFKHGVKKGEKISNLFIKSNQQNENSTLPPNSLVVPMPIPIPIPISLPQNPFVVPMPMPIPIPIPISMPIEQKYIISKLDLNSNQISQSQSNLQPSSQSKSMILEPQDLQNPHTLNLVQASTNLHQNEQQQQQHETNTSKPVLIANQKESHHINIQQMDLIDKNVQQEIKIVNQSICTQHDQRFRFKFFRSATRKSSAKSKELWLEYRNRLIKWHVQKNMRQYIEQISRVNNKQ